MFAFLILGLIVPVALRPHRQGNRRPPPRSSRTSRRNSRARRSRSCCGACATTNIAAPSTRSKSRTYNGADPDPSLRLSQWIDPFHWYGVVETPAFFALAPVNSLTPEVDPEGRIEIRYKPEETPVTLAAKKSYIGRVFLDWAQYPITETETLQPPQEGYIVVFQDLRFAGIPRSMTGRPGRARALSKAVQLDKNLHVVGDVYDTDKRLVVPEPDQR